MELILKKNGSLSYKTFYKKDISINVTKNAIWYLMYFLKLERGVTLRQFLELFNNKHSILILDNILAFCQFRKLMKEAFREDAKINKYVEKLIIKRNSIEIYSKTRKVPDILNKNEMLTIKPYTVGNDWFYFSGRRKNVYFGIWPSSISHYMDLPLIIDNKFDIYHTKYKKMKKIYEIDTRIRMIDVLYAICYEMTFDGVYTLEEERKMGKGKKVISHELMSILKKRLKETKGNDK